VPLKTIPFFERTRNWAWVFTLLTEVILIAIIAVRFWPTWAQMFGLN
jgi:hypothetical protein